MSFGSFSSYPLRLNPNSSFWFIAMIKCLRSGGKNRLVASVFSEVLLVGTLFFLWLLTVLFCCSIPSHAVQQNNPGTPLEKISQLYQSLNAVQAIDIITIEKLLLIQDKKRKAIEVVLTVTNSSNIPLQINKGSLKAKLVPHEMKPINIGTIKIDCPVMIPPATPNKFGEIRLSAIVQAVHYSKSYAPLFDVLDHTELTSSYLPLTLNGKIAVEMGIVSDIKIQREVDVELAFNPEISHKVLRQFQKSLLGSGFAGF